MPLNKALELLKSDYVNFINHLKASHSNVNKPKNQFNDENENGFINTPRSYLLIDEKQKNLINNLINKLNKDSKLNIFELDLILTYLNKKKEEITQAFANDEDEEDTNYNNENDEEENENDECQQFHQQQQQQQSNNLFISQPNNIPPLLPSFQMRPMNDLMGFNQAPSSTQQLLPNPINPMVGMNQSHLVMGHQSSPLMNLGDLMSLNQNSTSLLPHPPNMHPQHLMSLMNQSNGCQSINTQSLMSVQTGYTNNNNINRY